MKAIDFLKSDECPDIKKGLKLNSLQLNVIAGIMEKYHNKQSKLFGVGISLVSKEETDIMAKDYVKIMTHKFDGIKEKEQRYMDYKNGLENMQEVIECLT